jgi:glucose-1-phosphate adenylyltransferase
VDDSVLFSNATVARSAVIHKAILDKNVVVEEGAEIGVDAEADRARGFSISDGGITVVGKGTRVRK